MPETIEPATLPNDLPPASHRRVFLVLGTVVAVMIGVIACIERRVPGTNGAWYHEWLWQHVQPWPLYGLMATTAVPFVIAQFIHDRVRQTRTALVLLIFSNFIMQLAVISQQPLGFSRIEAIVNNGVNTGYYSAAKVLCEQQAKGIAVSDWMSLFPTLMDDYLMGHAKYKPPGLILYYMAWIKLLGPTALTRTLAGCGVGLIGSTGIAATFWLIRLMTGDRASAFYAASFLALIPSLIVFLPQFDQAYVPMGLLLIGAWVIALRTGRPALAVIFGLAMAAFLFCTYTFLMLGVFLTVYTILYMGDRGRAGIETAVRQAIYATLVIVAAYALLWLWIGFNPIEVYQTAQRLQRLDTIHFARPFPYHMKMDLLDVILGTGWISVPLLIAGFITLWRNRITRDPRLRLALLGLLQVGMAIGVAVFPGENARLLLLLMPLLMLPIGAELSRWPMGYRLAAFACLWTMTVMMAQNMTFLRMPGDGN